MHYTKEDVMAYVEEEDVKFIRLVFCDIHGIQKNISIMKNQLEKAFDKGLIIDSGAIDGLSSYGYVVLHPVPDTISLLPWRPSQGRVIRMFCNITAADGSSIMTGRKFLEDTIQKSTLPDVRVATKFRFYLFKLDSDGNNTFLPYDNASYMDIAPADKGENIRREVCLSLDEMEIPTCGSHHDAGPGQNHIALVEQEPLVAAENAITFESVVKTMAARNGLYADFSHKPKENLPSSKHEIIISLSKDKIRECYENLKKHYDEIYFFLNNTDHLYQSYQPETNVSYDEINNEIHIRRVINSANFYIAYSLLLLAMENSSVTNTRQAVSKNVAKEIAKESMFIQKNVPAELLKEYLG